MIPAAIREFKDTFNGLTVENSFKRNLAVTFSGQAFGQIVGFFFTPFIARVYGPESYGIFSLFIAISTNFSSLATLQLPTGYVSARSQHELQRLLQITLISLVFFTLLYSLLVLFFKGPVLSLLDAGSLTFLIYLVPVYAFFMGFDYMMLGWNISLKEFGRGALAKVSSTILSKSATLLYGLLVGGSPIGLVAGNFVIYPLESVIKFSKRIRNDFSALFERPNWPEIKEVFLRYKSYPLFVTPGLLISSINGQLPVYFFSIHFQNSLVGFFALASSIVTVPLSVITNSTTSVFLQKAAETHRTDPTSLQKLVLSLHKKLFLLCFFPLSLFGFVSDWLFKFVFGSDWEQAGWIAGYLAVSAILSAPQQPLSVLFRLLDNEHNNFKLSIIAILMRSTGLGIGVFFHNVGIAVAGYSLATILTHILSLTWSFDMVKINRSKLVWYVVPVLVVFALLTFQKFQL